MRTFPSKHTCAICIHTPSSYTHRNTLQASFVRAYIAIGEPEHARPHRETKRTAAGKKLLVAGKSSARNSPRNGAREASSPAGGGGCKLASSLSISLGEQSGGDGGGGERPTSSCPAGRTCVVLGAWSSTSWPERSCRAGVGRLTD